MLRKKMILFGVVVFVTIFMFIWGFGYLKGTNIFAKEREYFAVYEQTNGLNIGSPVTFKGIKIGQIKYIDFSDEYATSLIVTFNLEKDFKIPQGSIAEIYNTDLLGTKGLRIISSDQIEFYTPGDTMISRIEVSLIDDLSEQIGPIKEKTEELMVSVDSVISVINSLILQNRDIIDASIKNINSTIQNFENVSSQINYLVTNPQGKFNIILSDLQAITTMLKNNEANLNNAINNFSNISDSLAAANLAQTIQQTNNVLTELNLITQKINGGNGTIGQLINNDSLYFNIEDLTNNLNLLIEDIQENPRKYLRVSIIDMSKNN
ncbi:MAG: MCE family protein [Bacteroidales bacterium]|nr:MCE family protein [Bacteroidales bacterium]